MEFSELYRYLLFKSVAYSLCEETIGKLRYAREKFMALKESVRTARDCFLYWFKEVEQFVENTGELKEIIDDAEGVWLAHPLQEAEIKPRRELAVMEEFVEEYKRRLKTFDSLAPRVDFQPLRRHGISPLLCDEPAIYVSAAGKLVFPSFAGGFKFKCRSGYSDSYSFVETLRLIFSVRHCERVEYLRFYFASDHRGVAYNQENKVVAISIDRHAEEIDDHVGIQVLKGCLG